MPEPTRPRVLLVTRNLPPLVGGMERLNLNIARALAVENDVAVVGPRGCASRLALPDALVVEVPVRPLPMFLGRAALLALRIARDWRPRAVVAGSGLTAPMAWLAARACGARFVVYVHGLDLVVASLPYRLGWLPMVRRADLVIANSRNTRRLAVAGGVEPARVVVLNPGTTLPPPDPGARGRFRATHGLGDEPLLLSVGRLTSRKGLAPFVERALPGIVQALPGAKLLVIGGDAVDAAGANRCSERARIEQAARRGSVSDAVVFLPPCEDAALADAYEAADVHVFPVLDLPGDVEGFGMVAVEAAAHGLPTVAFDAGGAADAVVEGVTGILVPAGDYASFSGAVVQALGSTEDRATRERACRAAATRFGWDTFGTRLRALLPGQEAS